MLNLRASYKLKENMFETKEGLEKGMTEARTWRSPGVQESRGCGTAAA